MSAKSNFVSLSLFRFRPIGLGLLGLCLFLLASHVVQQVDARALARHELVQVQAHEPVQVRKLDPIIFPDYDDSECLPIFDFSVSPPVPSSGEGEEELPSSSLAVVNSNAPSSVNTIINPVILPVSIHPSVNEQELFNMNRQMSKTRPSATRTMAPEPKEHGECLREYGKFRLRRYWTITYAGDDKLNGEHCGLSVYEQLKKSFSCMPLTGFTCVTHGVPGEVTMMFKTPSTCRDEKVLKALRMGTRGKVAVYGCDHLHW